MGWICFGGCNEWSERHERGAERPYFVQTDRQTDKQTRLLLLLLLLLFPLLVVVVVVVVDWPRDG